MKLTSMRARLTTHSGLARCRTVSRKAGMIQAAGLCVACLAIVSHASAGTITANPITDTNPSTSNPFTAGQTVDANATASGIGRGTGITANAGGDRYNAASWNLSALDSNDYFTWTITPKPNFELDFASLVYTGQRSNSGPSSFALRSSIDGFASNIGTPIATGATIDLSAPAFQGLTGATEFRLYGWGGTSAAGTYSVNDFTFSGSVNSVAVPEPTAIGILLIAFVGTLGSRRRFR